MNPTVEQHAAAFAAFQDATPDRGPELDELWRRLTHGIDDEGAAALPNALGALLPLMVSDHGRLRLALDLLVAFDLYEAAADLVALAGRTSHPDVLLAAASLAANPGSPEDTVGTVARLVRRAPLSEVQRRAALIRLHPLVEGRGAREARLRAASWPGLFCDPGDRPPTVAVEVSSTYRAHSLDMVGAFRAAGASVRRLPPETTGTVRHEWLPRDPIVVLYADGPGLPWWMGSGAVDGTPRVVEATVRRPTPRSRYGRDARPVEAIVLDVDRMAGSALALRRDGRPAPQGLAHPLDRDVLESGSYDTLDMAFLGSGSRREVRRLAHDGLLEPAVVAHDGQVFRFDQLLGLRLWRYFRDRQPHRRPDPKLFHVVRELAGESATATITLTSDGRVLRLGRDQAEDVASGQFAFGEVIALDTLFRPFEIGGGRIPDVFTPSERVAAHPQIQGGTPTSEGTRLPVRLIATAYRLHGGVEGVRRMYPELDSRAIHAARHAGDEMQALV